MKKPNPKAVSANRRRFIGGKKPPPKGGKPCLIGDPVTVAKRLIRKNTKDAKDSGSNPKHSDPFFVIPRGSNIEEDYDPEYTRDFVPTLNDISGMAYCKLLRKGLYKGHAAELLGFKPRTVRIWRRKGSDRIDEIAEWMDNFENLLDDGKSPEAIESEIGPKPEFDKHARFFAASERAYANGEETLFSKIWNAAQGGDTGCCMWLLERRNPKRWGKAALRAIEGDNHQDDVAERGDPTTELGNLIAEQIERERKSQGS